MLKLRKWNFLSLTVLTKTALLEVSWMVTIQTAVIFPTSSVFAELKKGNEDKITYTPQNSVTFYYLFNVNRQSYKQTMKQSDKEKTDSRAAMQNKDFRQAINFAFDRHAYAAQTNGEDGADRILT